MWVLEYPTALLLLLLLPPAIYLKHFWPQRGGRIRFPFAIYNGTGFRPKVWRVRLANAVGVITFWVGLVALIVALAGPAQVSRRPVHLSRGIDIMVVLDESPTMAAQDFQPGNRLEAAKEVVRRFVLRRENDPVGLVSFAKEAALRVPPTTDHDHLLQALGQVRIMELGDGTAIGLGLAVGALHLEAGQATERVMILLTDGKNNAGEISPEAAAEIAADLGIRIYTIGVGREGETSIEFEDPESGAMYRGTVVEAFDEEQLRTLADLTGGSYFHAASAAALDSVLQSIDSIETVERRTRVEVQSEPMHRQVAGFGALLLLLEFVLRALVLKEIL